LREKNLFSGFFYALAIQINQRRALLQDTFLYVNFFGQDN